ncbi:MAG: sulfatase-like hydrolase/transferase, partial [Deltaproteobacteria bacterium]|nr:sulfatase-like hydrolase/transferase [Deltaproteobacteria bacterium]
PCRVFDDGPLPAALAAATAGDGDYAGYLSHLIYADRALADFVEQLFAAPLGDRTLVVLLGDHGSGIRSHVPLTEIAQRLSRYRIPIALLGKNVPQPAALGWPANQIDVAPTIAAVVGLRGQVSWLGRNALVEPGSDFVAQSHDGLLYRGLDRLCERLPGERGARCRQAATAIDPLLAPELPEIAEEPAQTQSHEQLMAAIRQLVSLDLLAPHDP